MANSVRVAVDRALFVPDGERNTHVFAEIFELWLARECHTIYLAGSSSGIACVAGFGRVGTHHRFVYTIVVVAVETCRMTLPSL